MEGTESRNGGWGGDIITTTITTISFAAADYCSFSYKNLSKHDLQFIHFALMFLRNFQEFFKAVRKKLNEKKYGDI